VGHLGELEQLILFAVTALGDDAYGGAIRAHIEERSGRIVSSGAINTTLGRLAERRLVVGRVGTPVPGRAGRPRKYYGPDTSGGSRPAGKLHGDSRDGRGRVAAPRQTRGGRELTPRRAPIGRLLAGVFIRGADAPFIPRDLDDAFNHDVARGLAPGLIDVRLGLRSMVRTPGLSFVAVCALANGPQVSFRP
jgi:hypothetical protein